MAQKKFYKHVIIFSYFICNSVFGLLAADESAPRSVELISSAEFTFTREEPATFTIRPLKQELRAIENLKDTEAVGVIYLGDIELTKNATPLSALRDVSVQISRGLELDLALITDSNTSQSLAPHELLLLYHPELVITLALTKIANGDIENSEATAEESETVEESTNEESEKQSSEATDTTQVRGQYSLIGTYAIPPNPLPELIAPSEEFAE